MSRPPPPETARLFFAIPLGAPVLESIANVQSSLQARLAKDAVRWTRPGHLHLTLRFLGDVPGDLIGELKSVLARACQGARPLRLTLDRPGCFPDFRKPRIIWIGIAGDVDGLRELHDLLVRETGSVSVPAEDRPFHPHLTIGRVKASHPGLLRQCGETVQRMDLAAISEWTTREVVLWKSDLGSAGPTHTRLATATLGNV